MNVTLFEDALELKVNRYVESGMSLDAAIGRAEHDLVSGLSGGPQGAELHFLRHIVQGAAQKMRKEGGELRKRMGSGW